MNYLFYDLICDSVNEQCETDVNFTLHFNGLPDYLTDSNCAICSTGNIPTLNDMFEKKIITFKKNKNSESCFSVSDKIYFIISFINILLLKLKPYSIGHITDC